MATGTDDTKRRRGEERCRRRWKADFDYPVDYNDHFETPLQAYKDLLPLLQALYPNRTGRDGDQDDQIILYDPYYCNGRTKTLLNQLGLARVVHEKRDFYKDMERSMVPPHDVLVTNPPYSNTHKEKCLEFCLQQFRSRDRPFFLLMPSYVATRSYFKRILGDSIQDVAYLVPESDYEYDHPEGTGHDLPPFSSLWFCGVGRNKMNLLKESWENSAGSLNSAKFLATYEELVSLGIISLQNRPNPRQRRKKQKLLLSNDDVATGTMITPPDPFLNSSKTILQPSSPDEAKTRHQPVTRTSKKKGRSRYRDETGKRTKKRF
mmetsp:Transcript_9981/g.15962  ORF Transcript_9981/g.15962 Transcript_9981/m.15962 type:complete len:320 (-) Transcript_9981:45-1004(-)